MISIHFPWSTDMPYNTIVKLDDFGIGESNPGVWCHRIDTLLDFDVFTPWYVYKDDTVL